MGCGASASSNNQNKRLIEVYDVGAKLGEGAFGVVHECTHRETAKAYAVKMIDKVEQEVDDIQREIDMIQTFKHRNVVGCLDVFMEKCFVCIVMEKYTGGDLVDGLQAHLKAKGKIQDHQLIHVAQQMTAAIDHLHGKTVVHRDVKGDNFLMDRPEITDPECHVALTDFGTAVYLRDDEKLTEHTGTRAFWSPEMCDRSYGFKVDVWALGVVSYGLLDGTFPFKDEKQIKEKKPRLPKVTVKCADFLKRCLEKDHRKRLSANEALNHPWITEGEAGQAADKTAPVPATEKRASDDSKANKDDDAAQQATALREEVNTGIADRRQELLQRLDNEYKEKKKMQVNNQGAKYKEDSDVAEKKPFHAVSFSTEGPKKGELSYWEWWDEAQLRTNNVLAAGTSSQGDGGSQQAKGTLVDLSWTPAVVQDLLKKHGIDVSKFGKGQAKTLDELCREIIRGEAHLMQDATEHKKLVRVVDVVLLRIRSSADKKGKFLIEAGEQYADGRRRTTCRMPGTKQRPHESVKGTAQRVLATILRMVDCDVRFRFSTKELFEEVQDSPSYPGMHTVYRKHIVEGIVCSKDPKVLERVGVPKGSAWSCEGDRKDQKYWEWWTQKQCQDKGVKLNAAVAKATFSGLIQAPIGFSEENVRDYLMKYNINVELFGQGAAKSLAQIAQEMSQGESCLMENSSGKVVRVTDVVLLRLKEPTSGRVLVETEQQFSDGRRRVVNRLPGTKRRPNENIITTSRRILSTMLKIEEDDVNVGQTELLEEERDSPSYPGIMTVYRKHIVVAEVASHSGETAPAFESADGHHVAVEDV
eukprot:gnl/MRDRNA2_/MRDRNA2_116460_c0_seq1.p1 gnl/MRDRNA2_/MRDRNA2_116460_c0~~gnl/MRDRNA2_/MRDRNA2_116460_c0_seq1.p1  ORF type:complete len:812 (-),score=187.17 gnl/MRDRNA2_/MRDRNA2_116460_c0_seq1:107-2542(-)